MKMLEKYRKCAYEMGREKRFFTYVNRGGH